MLDYKGIEYKRTDLLPVISKGLLRGLGFPGVTVPALKIDGRKVQGSREIARALDRPARATALSRRPGERAAVERPSASGTRSSSIRSARSSGGR